MLILTRKPNEALFIGNDTTVTVLSVSGQQVRLGITAPPEVQIDRTELRDRKLAGPKSGKTLRLRKAPIDPDETYHDHENAS